MTVEAAPKKTAAGTAQRLVLLDAHAYLHRAFHALPPLTNSKGEPVGALFGFAKTVLKLIRELGPDRFAVCFDTPGPTFRDKRYAEYKATRKETDPALKTQLSLARELVDAWGLPAVGVPGFEADDLMAALARRGADQGMEVVLVTADKDVLQLVDDRIKVYREGKGIVDAAAVEAKYGVPPARLTDYFGLIGDAVDNVPGVKGIGPGKAAQLLKEYGGLDAVLGADEAAAPAPMARLLKAVREQKEAALLSRELVTLDSGAPVPELAALALPAAPGGELLGLLRRFEFSSLVPDLFKEAETPRAPALAETSIADLAGSAPGATAIALDAEGFAVAAGGKVAFLPASPAPKELKALGALLAGPVLGHDLKRAVRALRPLGLGLDGAAFDTMLAVWCLNPSRPRFTLDDAVLEHLRETLPAGPGRARLAAETAAVHALAGKLGPELEAKGLKSLYETLEMPLIEVLAAMEEAGIAVDRPYLAGLSQELGGRIAALEREMTEMAGAPINLNSPKQIAAFLFQKLNLPSQRKTKTGFSTDDEVLRALAPLHPFPAKLIEYRELTRYQTTYVDALLAASEADGRVHTRFLQTGAATGRLSSVEPNLQNIPIRTAEGQKVRRAFVAPEGSVLLAADYSQIDLRVMAHLSGDKALLAAFASGQDIHSMTAREVFHLGPGDVDAEHRRRAKAINFGIIYGQTAHGLAQGLGIGVPEAQDYIKRYFERYPGVQAWIQNELTLARKEGCVRTLLGRVRWVPDIASPNAQIRGFAERVAVNTPIQGTSADIIKKAMLSIHRGLEGKRTRMVLQIHDELVFEVPKDELAWAAPFARREMEGAVKLSVATEVGLKTGTDWRDMERA